jgi:hypothetical protein
MECVYCAAWIVSINIILVNFVFRGISSSISCFANDELEASDIYGSGSATSRTTWLLLWSRNHSNQGPGSLYIPQKKRVGRIPLSFLSVHQSVQAPQNLTAKRAVRFQSTVKWELKGSLAISLAKRKTTQQLWGTSAQVIDSCDKL